MVGWLIDAALVATTKKKIKQKDRIVTEREVINSLINVSIYIARRVAALYVRVQANLIC